MAGNRITGRFGTLSMTIAGYDGGNGAGAAFTVAELIDWTLDFTVESARCGIKGETVEPASVGGAQVAITAERIMTNTTGTAGGGAVLAKALMQHYGGAAAPVQAYGPATAGPPGVEAGYTLVTGGSGSTVAGAGIITRARLNAPRDLSRDNFEMLGTSLPTVT